MKCLLLVFLYINIVSVNAAEYFHYYVYSKKGESLEQLVKRNFVVSRDKEKNYAFFLKLMKWNTNIKTWSHLDEKKRIYMRLSKVNLNRPHKLVAAVELAEVPQFYIDDLVSDEEKLKIQKQLHFYLAQKKIKSQSRNNVRMPASVSEKSELDQLPSVEQLLESEQNFIENNKVKTD